MDRVEIEHALGLLVVAHHRVVAGEAEDVGDAHERRRQQVGLQAQTVAVAAGGLEDGVAAAADDLAGDRERAQAHDRALVVGDVQAVDLVLEQVDVVQHALDIGALRRADLAGDDEVAAIAGVAVGAHYTSLPIFALSDPRSTTSPGCRMTFQSLGSCSILSLSSRPSFFSWLMDERPGAVHLRVHFALAVAGAAARDR